MPIQHAIWQVGDTPSVLPTSKLVSEQVLEEMIVRDPRILSSEWMLIGRQEITTYGGRIDLLAIAPDGSLILIELKRDKTPRDIVAQALDYAAWVTELTADRVVQIYQRFSGGRNLQTDFEQRFGRVLDDEELNQAHQIIIVAAELDASTERIVDSNRDLGLVATIWLPRRKSHGRAAAAFERLEARRSDDRLVSFRRRRTAFDQPERNHQPICPDRLRYARWHASIEVDRQDDG